MTDQVYRYGNYYIAGVAHVVPGYYQDIVIIYKEGTDWKAISAERFRSSDSTLNIIKDTVKFSVHEDDLKQAIQNLRNKGIKIDVVNSPPFPRKLLEGKKRIQEEFD